MTNKFTFLLLTILSTSGFALETDQFIAVDIDLKDSSEVMNSYFNKNIEKSLIEANAKKLSCEQTALKVMENLTGKFSISKASSYASASALVERFPYDNISERSYKDQSFYEHAWLPLQVVDLARTININGIHLGTDKFGHFTHMGMSYYKNYLKFKKVGLSESGAIKKAIIKGFNSEYGILGYGIGGVLSYADLEANYQGFMFALDMCRTENALLIVKEGEWIENPKHRFDLRSYFTPKLDESFNLSFWRKPLYERIQKKLLQEYCNVQKSPMYQERMITYRRILKENLNDLLIQDNILTQEKYDRRLEDIEKACLK